jgi:hypothetical protein
LNSFQPGELPSNKELLYKWDFFNNMTIHQVILEGSPVVENNIKTTDKKGVGSTNPALINTNTIANASLPYLLICYVDLNEIPNSLKDIFTAFHTNNSISSTISWIIRIFSSDTLGFVRDSTKEDSEKALKDAWEIAEAGRAEKAKRSRLRFLTQMKKERGEKLSPEEEKLLVEERERKTLTSNDPSKETSNKDTAVNSKKNTNSNTTKEKESNTKKTSNAPSNNTASTKGNLPSNLPTTNPSINPSITKPLPNPESHTSDYVKSFLSYTYQERTIVFNNSLRQIDKVIVDEKIKEEKAKEVLKMVDDYEAKRQYEINDTMNNVNNITKVDFTDNLRVFLRTASAFRKEIKDDKETLIKARERIKNDIQIKLDIEKNILEFIKFSNAGGNVDSNALSNAVSMYKEALTLLEAEGLTIESPSNKITTTIKASSTNVIPNNPGNMSSANINKSTSNNIPSSNPNNPGNVSILSPIKESTLVSAESPDKHTPANIPSPSKNHPSVSPSVNNIKALAEKLYTIISNKKEESLRNDLKKLTNKDKAIVIKHLEDIDSNKWNINEEVIKKLNELVK